MDKRKVIDYLTVKGFTKDKIIQVLNSNAMRSECEKIILSTNTKCCQSYSSYYSKSKKN